MHGETDKAYLAGFIDGDGHIQIALRSGSWSGHQLFVKITNTDIALMEALAEEWGAGRIQRNRPRTHWKPTVDIIWSTDNAVQLLKVIQPYLRRRSEHCNIALEFAKTIRKPNAKARAITIEEWDYREHLRTQMKMLNRRAGAEEPKAVPSPLLERANQVCQKCRKQFTSNRQRKFCSTDCSRASGLQAFRERNKGLCGVCGKEFLGRKKTQKYCSLSCSAKSQWINGTGASTRSAS